MPSPDRAERVPTILLATLLYRVATSMGPLAILVTVSAKESLAVASFSLAGWTLTGALGPPLWVAVAARAGQRVTLLLLGAATAGCHIAMGVLPGPALSIVAATLAGATLPPVTAQARAQLSAMLVGDERDRAFGAESALASLSFVVAPLIVGATNALLTLGPLLSCAALLAAVGVLYGQVAHLAADRHSAERARRGRDAPDRETSRLARFRAPWIGLVGAGAASYGMLACLEVATVARLDDPGTIAIVLSAWSGGSLLGGLVMARVGRAQQVRAIVLPIPPLACVAMALFGTPNAWIFSAILIASGPAVAPTLATITSEMARVTQGVARLRAYAWLQTGSWIGAAVATSAAGVLAESFLRELLILAAVLGAGVVLGVRRSAGRYDVRPNWPEVGFRPP
jgi:MFS family permease